MPADCQQGKLPCFCFRRLQTPDTRLQAQKGRLPPARILLIDGKPTPTNGNPAR